MSETKKITRKNLVENYKNALVKLEELKSKKYEFKTNRACTPFNEVSKLTLLECVKAYASVHDGVMNFDKAMEVLGVTNEDIKSDERKYLGFPVDDWDHDFKLRVEQIKDEVLRKKYEKVITVFKNNFSDEDKFEIEMSEVMDLGIDI